MVDKKLSVAILIIVALSLILSYSLFAQPLLNGYVAKKQQDAREEVVNNIIYIVNQQGYISLGNQTDPVILIDRRIIEGLKTPDDGSSFSVN